MGFQISGAWEMNVLGSQTPGSERGSGRLLSCLLGRLELEDHEKLTSGSLSRIFKAERASLSNCCQGQRLGIDCLGSRCRIWEFQIPANRQISRRWP